MKHKTKIEGVVLVRKEGNPDDLRKSHRIYRYGKDYAIVAQLYDLEYDRDIWLSESSLSEGFGLKTNGGGIVLYEDINEVIKFVDEPHHEYSWCIPEEPLSLETELTGHMYRGSAHETCDSCGNCDGARCDTCTKRYIVYNWATSEKEFATSEKEAAKQYLKDNYLQEEAVRAITEISKEFGVENKDEYLDFSKYSPIYQFLKLCKDTGAIGYTRKSW